MKKQLVIVGGGPAGLAAAIAAYDEGIRDLLVIERDERVGGILNQCIHNGFGLHTFSEELTGPEYALRYIDEANKRNIEIWTKAMVLSLSADKKLSVVGEECGAAVIEADAVILACGCRERPRGAINIAGTRPSGIFSAGTAQRLVNIEGLKVGKKVVVLGSGDIGLIMARRMTFEGAKVQAVLELMPYSSGLARNIVQCLNDFDIPLLFSTTVVGIEGKERVEAVIVAEVDANRRPIESTKRRIECDTLLLSVGLLPENELGLGAQIETDAATGGAVVDDTLMTSANGVFACGNVLHVHDLVDYVSEESAAAGKYAAEYLRGGKEAVAALKVQAVGGVRYTVPQKICLKGSDEKLTFRLRTDNVYRKTAIEILADGKSVYRKARPVVTPGEMETVTVKGDAAAKIRTAKEVVIRLDGGETR